MSLRGRGYVADHSTARRGNAGAAALGGAKETATGVVPLETFATVASPDMKTAPEGAVS